MILDQGLATARIVHRTEGDRVIWLGPWRLGPGNNWYRDFLHNGVKIRKIIGPKYHGFIRLKEKM